MAAKLFLDERNLKQLGFTEPNVRTMRALTEFLNVQNTVTTVVGPIEALTTTGLLARVGLNQWATRTLTGPAAGIAVTNGDGVADNPTLALANDLAAYEELSANGMVARTGDGTAAVRTITASGGNVHVANGDGVSGNPTISVDSANVQTLLDGISSTQGSILYRDASAWSALPPGTSGQYLKTLGAGADPAWATVSGGGSGYHAVSIQGTANSSTSVNVNSTSYLAFVPFNFFLDRDVFAATHFRIVIRGLGASEAGQTIKCQMASATAPTTPLHTGGDDLTCSNGNATYDSGWRTFDDGGTGLLFGTIALKGSNSTVDLQFNNAMIMFKK